MAQIAYHRCRKITCITAFYLPRGIQPRVARLYVICLRLGILSTVIGWAVDHSPFQSLASYDVINQPGIYQGQSFEGSIDYERKIDEEDLAYRILSPLLRLIDHW